jgi:arylsulfatase
MLNTLGGAFGGYGLYLVKGKPVHLRPTHDGTFPMGRPRAHASGHTIVFDFKYDGRRFRRRGEEPAFRRWTARKRRQQEKKPHTIPFLVSLDESSTSG